MSSIQEAMKDIGAMQVSVDAGRILPKFGSKCQRIIADAMSRAGGADGGLDRYLDGPLHALFLRQLAMLRERVARRFEADRRLDTAVERAERTFVAAAQDLVRPGSEWSYEAQRDELVTSLREALASEAVVQQERYHNKQSQRITADIISKLQGQMEALGDKLPGAGGGSPWVFWTSYRVPGTPFHVSGKYRQGRTNIQLSLSPNKDPANAEAGFVEGLTPQNLGLSLNVGV